MTCIHNAEWATKYIKKHRLHAEYGWMQTENRWVISPGYNAAERGFGDPGHTNVADETLVGAVEKWIEKFGVREAK